MEHWAFIRWFLWPTFSQVYKPLRGKQEAGHHSGFFTMSKRKVVEKWKHTRRTKDHHPPPLANKTYFSNSSWHVASETHPSLPSRIPPTLAGVSYLWIACSSQKLKGVQDKKTVSLIPGTLQKSGLLLSQEKMTSMEELNHRITWFGNDLQNHQTQPLPNPTKCDAKPCPLALHLKEDAGWETVPVCKWTWVTSTSTLENEDIRNLSQWPWSSQNTQSQEDHLWQAHCQSP